MNNSYRVVMLAASLVGVGMVGCSAEDPFDFGGPRSCEVGDQNEWVYSLMQQAYLFSDDLAEVDPLEFDSPATMVGELRVAPDRWSRVSDKGRTTALFQEGKTVGLGFRTRRSTDGRVVVATVDEGSPAAAAGMQRGDVIAAVGGLATAQLDEEDGWSDAYGESEPGVTVELQVEALGGEVRELSLVKDWVSIVTVPVTRVHQVGTGADSRPVGYLVLSTFVDTSTAALNEAFAELNRAGVREVVVDLRYNSGGLVGVARHFMHLLAGAVAEGRTAYLVRYNDAFSDENDARELVRLQHSLPAVDHVVFITTGSTLSASELLINAVAAHVPVSIVGDTTGGKPVGSKHFEFCDKIAVPLTFRLLNADGVGDYYDGLPATCLAGDGLDRPLGDADEQSLATALHLLDTGECLPLESERSHTPELPPELRTAPATEAPVERRIAAPFEAHRDAIQEQWPELGGLR